jgi:hypothetical protein
MIDGTPFFKLYARQRQRALQMQNAPAEQTRQLLSLTARAAHTRFGRDHDFARIASVADFQARVPLRRYENMWNDYWKPVFPKLIDCSWPGVISYFALSSGTTSGTTKYIPCSDEMNRTNTRAALDVLVHHVTMHPNSRVLGGKTFMLGGSTDLTELAPGIYSGDLSGIAAMHTPVWAKPRVFPPRDLALIADWEQKIDVLSRAIIGQDIRTVAGTPSWVLLFFERLFAAHPERERKLKAFFPNLELVIHGGVNFTPYRSSYASLMEGGHAETREVYPASEGFFASADRGLGEGMRVMADNGLFLEFVPVAELGAANPTRHWLANVETGVEYALAVSSCAGLWSYIVGDTVKFVSRDPPRLLVTGRTSYYLSAFGEHLTGSEVEDSVSDAAAAIGARISDFSVGAIYPDGGRSRGGHLFVVEFGDGTPSSGDTARFLAALDEGLSQRNDDYRGHRAGGFGLDPPRLLAVSRGTFEAWMKARGQLGGQHKVPRIVADETLFASLRSFAEARADATP